MGTWCYRCKDFAARAENQAVPTRTQSQVHLPCVLGRSDKRGSRGVHKLYEIASGGTFMELVHAWLPCNTSRSFVCLYLSGGLWKPARKGTFRSDESYPSEFYCTTDGHLLPSALSRYPSSDHTFAKRQGSTITTLWLVLLCEHTAVEYLQKMHLDVIPFI